MFVKKANGENMNSLYTKSPKELEINKILGRKNTK